MSENRYTPDDEMEESEGFDEQQEEAPDEETLRRRRARDAGRQFRSKMAEFDKEDKYDKYDDDDDDSEKGPLLATWVKGLIGILVSLSLVAVIIMLFAKVLFLHEPSSDVKTGTITSAANTGTTLVTTTGDFEKQTKTTKEKIKFNTKGTETNKDGELVEEKAVSKIKCISPVYVHPQPNSSTENLTVVPLNAEVDFIKNENGWYYITYNGITGYAWGQFFTTPTTTNAQQ